MPSPSSLSSRAKAEADAALKRIQESQSAFDGAGPATVAQLLRAHAASPSCSMPQRLIDLWTTLLGARPVDLLTRDDAVAFARDRASGAIDARGNRVDDARRRRPVGARSIANDLFQLFKAIRWGMETYRRNGERELWVERRPLILTYRPPTNPNPRRPVATQERYDATMAVASQVASALPCVLALARHTGRRIGAICALRLRDLRLAPTDVAPWGAIVWPADTDKRGREWEAPLNRPARDALDAWLAHDDAGDDHLFPHPDDNARPIDKDVASGWLRRAESLARLPKLDRGVWHPYRRLWASERRHLSPIDVAAAGGWGDTRTLERTYQHADARGVLRTALNDHE
jgi:integrase